MSELSKAAAEVEERPTMQTFIEKQKAGIERQLGGAMNSESFVRAVLTEVRKSPGLQVADPTTVMGGIMLAAQLKLEIGSGLGEFYLTPRKEKGKPICLPIIGYQGYIKLALRSEYVVNVQAAIVREGDEFWFGSDGDKGINHRWNPRDMDESRTPVGVLATARMRAGGTTWVYLTAEQVIKRRPNYWESTPWASNSDEMWKKTAVRALAKYLPKSTDLGRAIEADEQKVSTVRGLDDLEIQRTDEDVQDAEVVPDGDG